MIIGDFTFSCRTQWYTGGERDTTTNDTMVQINFPFNDLNRLIEATPRLSELELDPTCAPLSKCPCVQNVNNIFGHR